MAPAGQSVSRQTPGVDRARRKGRRSRSLPPEIDANNGHRTTRNLALFVAAAASALALARVGAPFAGCTYTAYEGSGGRTGRGRYLSLTIQREGEHCQVLPKEHLAVLRGQRRRRRQETRRTVEVIFRWAYPFVGTSRHRRRTSQWTDRRQSPRARPRSLAASTRCSPDRSRFQR